MVGYDRASCPLPSHLEILRCMWCQLWCGFRTDTEINLLINLAGEYPRRCRIADRTPRVESGFQASTIRLPSQPVGEMILNGKSTPALKTHRKTESIVSSQGKPRGWFPTNPRIAKLNVRVEGCVVCMLIYVSHTRATDPCDPGARLESQRF